MVKKAVTAAMKWGVQAHTESADKDGKDLNTGIATWKHFFPVMGMEFGVISLLGNHSTIDYSFSPCKLNSEKEPIVVGNTRETNERTSRPDWVGYKDRRRWY